MNFNLQDLKTTKPHHLREFYSNYSRAEISKILKISTGYFNAVLNGSYAPGKDLEDRMKDLAAAIKEAEEDSRKRREEGYGCN
jgi:hypothetical protein